MQMHICIEKPAVASCPWGPDPQIFSKDKRYFCLKAFCTGFGVGYLPPSASRQSNFSLIIRWVSSFRGPPSGEIQKQESRAIAKMIAQCALYIYGRPENFRDSLTTPIHGYFSQNFMDFCSDGTVRKSVGEFL